MARRACWCRRKIPPRAPTPAAEGSATTTSRGASGGTGGAPSRPTSIGTVSSAICAPSRLRRPPRGRIPSPAEMDDVRWFAPNRYCTLIVPWLRDRGLSIARDGDGPARVAIAMDAQVAAEACRYAARHRCSLIHYVWDLPPWWLGRGRHDWVWLVAGRYVWFPRMGRRYAARRGFYSRLRYV